MVNASNNSQSNRTRYFQSIQGEEKRGRGAASERRGVEGRGLGQSRSTAGCGRCSSEAFSALFISVTSSSWWGGISSVIPSGETESRGGWVSPRSRLRKAARTPGRLAHRSISGVLDRGSLKNLSGGGAAGRRGGGCRPSNARCRRSPPRAGGRASPVPPLLPRLPGVPGTRSGGCGEEEDGSVPARSYCAGPGNGPTRDICA